MRGSRIFRSLWPEQNLYCYGLWLPVGAIGTAFGPCQHLPPPPPSHPRDDTVRKLGKPRAGGRVILHKFGLFIRFDASARNHTNFIKLLKNSVFRILLGLSLPAKANK